MPPSPSFFSNTEGSFAKIYPPTTDKSKFTLASIISGEHVSVITSEGNFYLANLADGKLVEDSEKHFMA
jgi:hypothetical protein